MANTRLTESTGAVMKDVYDMGLAMVARLAFYPVNEFSNPRLPPSVSHAVFSIGGSVHLPHGNRIGFFYYGNPNQ